MHIPDGLIPMGTPLIITTIIVIIALVAILLKSKSNLTERQIPQIALLIVAAVIVQMIELPLPVAACVHVSLITIITLYDFKSSVIVYTFVTIIQAILIGEGGVSTLGLNLLNLAILAPIFAKGLFMLVEKFNKTAAIAVSAFGTITLLGVVASVEYALAGVYPISFAFMTIVPVEALVGVLEAVVTVIIMKALKTMKPELVPVLDE
ncbi:MAG: energy-coupling factor ABC transporter permease [Methanosphaera sp.]|uniref:energy-coupling factor ABC transporter permease n=1 Tax=Methanosphaera sp. TaxID=2666342 RepID=UPI0025EDB259|nr:energy-coupling factor ABC transporter permease [Methanosphaera sp.]MCI5866511.1 energy-coupling factor ABC transporter permease [Methanosphaera sp.]MDD6534982.1 energy-coupling factor ABC transporter permease [Methanosphaera sp.]MDY3955415.1 energy-coupling factor ABC transporter permease [Methanosphaera sp.]